MRRSEIVPAKRVFPGGAPARARRLAWVGLALSFSLAGCWDRTATSKTNSNDPEIAAYDVTVNVNKSDHDEIEARDKKINLNATEQQGLQNSLGQIKSTGAASSHLDVDVQGGHLSFKADNDPSHMAGTNGDIRVSAQGKPIQAVLSPAAREYLQKR